MAFDKTIDGFLDQIRHTQALQHPDSAKEYHEQELAARDQKITELEYIIKAHDDASTELE